VSLFHAQTQCRLRSSSTSCSASILRAGAQPSSSSGSGKRSGRTEPTVAQAASDHGLCTIGPNTLSTTGRPNVPAPCPGSCNNAWRRAEQQLADDGTEHDIPITWGQPVHCQRCTSRAHAQLAELPELVVAVSLEALCGTAAKMTGTIGRTSTPAWPGQASRLLIDYIVGGMVELEDDLRDLRRLGRRPGRGAEGHDVTGAVRFLAAHLDWALVEHPLAQEIHDRLSGNPAAQIHGWHRAAQRFTRRDARLEHHKVPCPRCELLTLYRADGDDYIECRNINCALLLTPTEFHSHVKGLASECQAVSAA
jgi:hypothetical protein